MPFLVYFIIDGMAPDVQVSRTGEETIFWPVENHLDGANCAVFST